MLSDRFCIDSHKAIDVVLSPEDLVACDWYNLGCSGGNLYTAMAYLEHTGAVSDKCFPYTSGVDGTVPECPSTCVGGEKQKKYTCAPGSTVEATTPDEIKAEIYKNGPMETGFMVYSDFMDYKEGVY